MQSDKQSIRGVIVSLFPWLAGVVSVAGAAGKGLAIRTASGLLHLAGGPSDPAVHRKGDAGTAGILSVAGIGLQLQCPDGTSVIIMGATSAGPVSFTLVPIDFVPDPPPDPPPTPPEGALGSFTITTVSTEGSEKVTCA